MRHTVKVVLAFMLMTTALGGEIVFLEVPQSIQRRLKDRDHVFHSRVTVLAAQNEYLMAQGEEPVGVLTYSDFKSLVEQPASELSSDKDVSELKKMKCACSFKKLFVNTVEEGFTDLMIGKIKPGIFSVIRV